MPRPLFGPHRAGRDLGIFALLQEALKFVTIERLFPVLVGLPFVIAFPGEIGLVAETFREEAQEFFPTSVSSGQSWSRHATNSRGSDTADVISLRRRSVGDAGIMWEGPLRAD